MYKGEQQGRKKKEKQLQTTTITKLKEKEKNKVIKEMVIIKKRKNEERHNNGFYKNKTFKNIKLLRYMNNKIKIKNQCKHVSSFK